MLKKISLLLVLITTFFVSNVYAEVYQDKINEHGMWIPNEFVSKSKNGSTKYQQMTLIVRESDGKYLYCIEPGKSINEGNIFTGYDENQASHANLTEEQWDKINLIAYYGYGYKNHTDIKWYVITQFMIWQINNLGYDIYFTDSLNGNRIDKYQNEMNEINNLIEMHLKKPNFTNSTFNLLIDTGLTFFDRNYVLNQYELIVPESIKVDHDSGTLILKSTEVKNGVINFKKTSNRFFYKPIVYSDGVSQNLLLPGDLPDINCKYNYVTNYGSLTIHKHAKDKFHYKGSATLENALYAIYDSNNNLIEQKATDRNGDIKFDAKLKDGRYYFKEITPSEGYKLDPSEYYFEVHFNSYEYSFDVYEEIIKENFEITKYLNDSEHNLIIPEENIEFGIYDNNDNLLDTYKTSTDGTLNFSLAYGDYKLKQHTTYTGYEKINDYDIKVRNDGKINKLIFTNNLIRYRVNLNVKNKDTLKNISNIEFEIYDNNNNRICIDRNKCSYLTDSNGDILFPGYFDFNNYYIKLIHDDDFKYIYNDDIIKFTIDDNTPYRKVNDYRLVELEYFLSLKEEKIEEKVEDSTEEIMTIEKKVDDLVLEDSSDEEIIDDDKMVVEVPNTYKSDISNLLCLLVIIFFTRKKLL